MGREIKFQVLHNNKIIGEEIFTDGSWEFQHYLLNPDNGTRWVSGVFSKDKNYTRRQFTGLLDKNGKDIYEGDILNIKFGGDRNNPPYSHKKMVVYFEEEYLQWYVIGNNIINGNSLKGYHLAEYEIIGNIHETPELLK